MSVDIRRSSSRYVEREQGRRTQHAFSFGPHYDPAWLGFGPMVCHDDHLLGSGRGFATHAHADLEIVTTVLSGSLEHTDTLGTAGALGPGEVAVLTAGAGVEHSELASPHSAARFVQVWLRPDVTGAAPTYARGTSAAATPGAGLVTVAGEGSDLPVGVAGASYAVARLGAGESVVLPAAARLHAYVASGALLRSSLAEPLQAGDAYCFVDEPDHEVTAGVPTELLVWTFAATAG